MITIIDNLPPETVAMLQALYSRSPKPVSEHLASMKDSSSFMSTYYIGYGHKSIGDCGTITIFIEGCSMLAAKAIQDWPLYSGQEASTRYMDMGSSVWLDPSGLGSSLQEQSRSFYISLLAALGPWLKDKYPCGDADPKTWTKAIAARAFDIARGFLPAGCTTNLSWHTNLRQCWDHLVGLLCHPLEEVRVLAKALWAELLSRYPSSFPTTIRDMEWHTLQQQLRNYSTEPLAGYRFRDKLLEDSTFRAMAFRLINQRPPRAEIGHGFRDLGLVEASFSLDYGSYRDLQRQRSCWQNMPMLRTDTFEPWYLDQLPPEWLGRAYSHLDILSGGVAALGLDPLVSQYYIPMGYQVACRLVASVPSAVYIAELRSGLTVHPTLRVKAIALGDSLEGLGLSMYHDRSEDQWSLRRGTQDIERVV